MPAAPPVCKYCGTELHDDGYSNFPADETGSTFCAKAPRRDIYYGNHEVAITDPFGWQGEPLSDPAPDLKRKDMPSWWDPSYRTEMDREDHPFEQRREPLWSKVLVPQNAYHRFGLIAACVMLGAFLAEVFLS